MTSLVVPAWAWALLAILLVTCLTIDLVLHRGEHVDSKRRALVWTLVWVGVALGFNVFVGLQFGAEAGEQYFAAYLLEKSLSVDNLFLFIVVFAALKIPATEQRRVLTWGIAGALVMRAAFILAGVAALHRWHEITYVFGALLIITAIKLARSGEDHAAPRSLGWIERFIPWTPNLDGHKFVTRVSGRLVATPLLVALIAIELADVMFSLDSIPAAFAVSDEPFILYSSNVFAVLGLRALYIVLAGALAGLHYLKYGLVAVLAFAGAKLLAAPWIVVSPLVSVGVIATCIGLAVLASVIRAAKLRRSDGPDRSRSRSAREWRRAARLARRAP